MDFPFQGPSYSACGHSTRHRQNFNAHGASLAAGFAMFLGILLIPFSTHAADAFYSWTEGNWSVASGPGQCVAVNRPPTEFNMAPFVALSLIQKAGDNVRIRVHFWPGAFKKGEHISLEFKFFQTDEKLDFVAAATAVQSSDVELDQPFEHRNLAKLGDADLVLIRAIGDDPARQVGFGVKALRVVAFHLDGCSKRLTQQ